MKLANQKSNIETIFYTYLEKKFGSRYASTFFRTISLSPDKFLSYSGETLFDLSIILSYMPWR